MHRRSTGLHSSKNKQKICTSVSFWCVNVSAQYPLSALGCPGPENNAISDQDPRGASQRDYEKRRDRDHADTHVTWRTNTTHVYIHLVFTHRGGGAALICFDYLISPPYGSMLFLGKLNFKTLIAFIYLENQCGNWPFAVLDIALSPKAASVCLLARILV